MKLSKTQQTVIIVIAVLFVCGGTFLGARAMAKNARASSNTTYGVSTQTTIPVSDYYFTTTTAPAAYTTAADTQSTSMLTPVTDTTAATTTAAPSTEPTVGEIPSTNVSSLLTTYPSNQTVPIVTAAPTTSVHTMATTETTTKRVTTPSTTRTAADTSDSNISNAALFDSGFLSYLFNPDGNYYYTNGDPWQRNFGFNELYDVGAAFVVMYYDTVRFKFPYDGKDWMIQFWKGQYGWVFIGAEIGVYNKPSSRTVEHYDCASDEDSLKMSMTCFRDGNEIFTRDYGTYWWCTGFVPGQLDSFRDRSELLVQARLTLKDEQMLSAFLKAVAKEGFVLDKDYTVDGLDVYIRW